MSAWARWVEVADQRHYATVHVVEWTDVSPADVYRHYRQLDPDKYRPHGDGGLIVDTIAGTTSPSTRPSRRSAWTYPPRPPS